MKVSVSFIKSNDGEAKTISKLNNTSADYIHVDIMDGKFVENKNYSFKDIHKFTKDINKKLDVHLMCEKPDMYIESYAMLNTEYITFHLEAVSDPKRVIDLIHSYGLKCGVSIKPSTPVEMLEPYLSEVEQILIMTVEPGKGGQEFMMDMLPKIDYLKEKQTGFIISVDGGVNENTIKYLSKCDMVVSGSYICLSNNYEENIKKLKGLY